MVDIIPRVQPAQPNVNLPATVARFQQQAIEQQESPISQFAEGTQVAQRIATNEQIIQSNDIRNETAQVRLEQQKTTAQLVREQKEEDRIFNQKLQSASVNEQLNVLLSTHPKIVQRNQDVANAVAARVETTGSDGAQKAIQQVYKPRYQADLLRKEQERQQKQTFELEQIDRRSAAIDARTQSQIESIDNRASAALRLKRKTERRVQQNRRETRQLAERKFGLSQAQKASTQEAKTLAQSRKDTNNLLKTVKNGEETAALFNRESTRINVASKNAAGGAFELDGVRFQNERQAQQALNNRFAQFLPEKDRLLARIPPSIQQTAAIQAGEDIVPTVAKKILTREQFESLVKSRALVEFRRIKEANPSDTRTLADVENEIREDGLQKVELRG